MLTLTSSFAGVIHHTQFVTPLRSHRSMILNLCCSASGRGRIRRFQLRRGEIALCIRDSELGPQCASSTAREDAAKHPVSRLGWHCYRDMGLPRLPRQDACDEPHRIRMAYASSSSTRPRSARGMQRRHRRYGAKRRSVFPAMQDTRNPATVRKHPVKRQLESATRSSGQSPTAAPAPAAPRTSRAILRPGRRRTEYRR